MANHPMNFGEFAENVRATQIIVGDWDLFVMFLMYCASWKELNHESGC